MKKRDDSMMHFVNEDLLDDSDEDSEVLILEISEDLVGELLILIFEICLDEYFEVDLVDDEQKYVNEKI
jgi:hypothetical protein